MWLLRFCDRALCGAFAGPGSRCARRGVRAPEDWNDRGSRCIGDRLRYSVRGGDRNGRWSFPHGSSREQRCGFTRTGPASQGSGIFRSASVHRSRCGKRGFSFSVVHRGHVARVRETPHTRSQARSVADRIFDTLLFRLDRRKRRRRYRIRRRWRRCRRYYSGSRRNDGGGRRGDGRSDPRRPAAHQEASSSSGLQEVVAHGAALPGQSIALPLVAPAAHVKGRSAIRRQDGRDLWRGTAPQKHGSGER